MFNSVNKIIKRICKLLTRELSHRDLEALALLLYELGAQEPELSFKLFFAKLEGSMEVRFHRSRLHCVQI